MPACGVQCVPSSAHAHRMLAGNTTRPAKSLSTSSICLTPRDSLKHCSQHRATHTANLCSSLYDAGHINSCKSADFLPTRRKLSVCLVPPFGLRLLMPVASPSMTQNGCQKRCLLAPPLQLHLRFSCSYRQEKEGKKSTAGCFISYAEIHLLAPLSVGNIESGVLSFLQM